MGSSRSRRLHRRGARGQGLVEFALVAPLLLALAFGIFDFGRGMSANVTVTNASREGARWFSANASNLDSTTHYGSYCPTGTTAPSHASGQLQAWNQMLNANLSMSGVTRMTVYFYKSSNTPPSAGGFTGWDLEEDCLPSGGPFNGTVNPVTGSNTGDSSYSPQTGDWVEFRVTYQYTTTTPIIHQLVSTVTIDQATTMVLE
ncbi:MAG TPA: TadE family protein [Candidatus Dormibacteraeota bacterium]|nr:TadE family protein [Candidatus Dormibacteraeota bacterium]